VANLSQPGGNVTGVFVRQIELAAKRVEVAREAFPRTSLVGIVFDTLRASKAMPPPRRPASWGWSRG
jgi:hypothetical protein